MEVQHQEVQHQQPLKIAGPLPFSGTPRLLSDLGDKGFRTRLAGEWPQSALEGSPSSISAKNGDD